MVTVWVEGLGGDGRETGEMGLPGRLKGSSSNIGASRVWG